MQRLFLGFLFLFVLCCLPGCGSIDVSHDSVVIYDADERLQYDVSNENAIKRIDSYVGDVSQQIDESSVYTPDLPDDARVRYRYVVHRLRGRQDDEIIFEVYENYPHLITFSNLPILSPLTLPLPPQDAEFFHHPESWSTDHGSER